MALAILPEERHIAARFGEDWAASARRVPRWLGGRQAQSVPAVRHNM
jgi:protein-S-isoprenylcysteine O-methyltransferase Ste14